MNSLLAQLPSRVAKGAGTFLLVSVIKNPQTRLLFKTRCSSGSPKTMNNKCCNVHLKDFARFYFLYVCTLRASL